MCHEDVVLKYQSAVKPRAGLEMQDGLAIAAGSGQIRLKWHRLRRTAGDPEFGVQAMIDGFRLGASMELDLRVRGDGGFAVLHDPTLERETDGLGLVCDLGAQDIARLSYRAMPRPVLVSEDLAGLIPSAHPDALLQFDMKDDLAGIGQRGLDHLAEHFGTGTSPLIFSGADPDLIAAIGARLPCARRGIDPTDRLVDLFKADSVGQVEAALRAEIRGKTEPDTVYLSWELLLHARPLGLDLVALCHAEGVKVDAWTFSPQDRANGLSASEWLDFRALVALQPDQITTDDAIAIAKAWALPAPEVARFV